MYKLKWAEELIKTANHPGIIKEVDNLGRIVIPKEMRSLLGIEKEVEVVLTEDGVLLRNPEYTLTKRNNTCEHP